MQHLTISFTGFAPFGRFPVSWGVIRIKMDEEKLINFTFNKIIEGGFNPRTSPLKDKVVVMVLSAQGVIDNGGFEYFFEEEFNGNPDLNDFVLVFNAIGAIESSAAIENAIAIKEDGEPDKFDQLEEIMFANSGANYSKLAAYIKAEFI